MFPTLAFGVSEAINLGKAVTFCKFSLIRLAPASRTGHRDFPPVKFALMRKGILSALEGLRRNAGTRPACYTGDHS